MIGNKIFTSFIILVILSSSAFAAFNSAFPWHPLQQISGDYGTSSIDNNQDGIIDNSQSCTGDGICEANAINATGSLYLGNGIIMFNDTSKSYHYYNGSEWKQFGIGASDSWIAPSGTVAAFYATECPLGWIPANGSSGTPDLRGRTIIGTGTGTDINAVSRTFTLGQSGGEYAHTLTTTELPSHTHTAPAHTHDIATRTGVSGTNIVTSTAAVTGTITNIATASGGGGTTSATGSNTAYDLIQPYRALIYCIKANEDVDTSNLIWGQSGDNIFTLNNSKNIGIGTNSPTQKLHVEGNLNVTGSVYTSGSSVYIGTKSLSNDAGVLKWGGVTVATGTIQTTYVQGTCATFQTRSIATCPSGYNLTGGGSTWCGVCGGGPEYGFVRENYPVGNSWYAMDNGCTVAAWAVCMRIV